MTRRPIYLHDWSESGEAGMLADFGIAADALTDANVLVASYTYEDYSGSAYVLFERGGKLFEVHAGHCSCYGLSESSYCGDTTTQWQPEEADRDAVIHRLTKGTWGEDDKIKESILDALGYVAEQAAAA